jgi:hypothetical protein
MSLIKLGNVIRTVKSEKNNSIFRESGNVNAIKNKNQDIEKYNRLDDLIESKNTLFKKLFKNNNASLNNFFLQIILLVLWRKIKCQLQ